MSSQTLLLTGATGYIGGTILNQIRNSSNPTIKALNLAVLIRDDSRASTYSNAGIKTYFMKDLSDHDAIIAAASQADIVVHVGAGFHPTSPQSHIEGLAQRQKQTGKPTYYIHTSGTSDFADKPVTKAYLEPRTFFDTDTDLYDYLTMRENIEPYAQRTSCLATINAGLDHKVATTVITSPTIYGIGTGEYNTTSFQMPFGINLALKEGKAQYIDTGAGQWDHVHIQDLATLYEAVIQDWISTTHNAPTGKTGILFSGTGTFTWKSMAEQIHLTGQKLGILTPNSKPESITLDTAAAMFQGFGDGKQIAEAGFASNSRTRAVVGTEKLGWKPIRTEADWLQDFEDEWKIILDARAGK